VFYTLIIFFWKERGRTWCIYTLNTRMHIPVLN
jgi:hypothetical protein